MEIFRLVFDFENIVINIELVMIKNLLSICIIFLDLFRNNNFINIVIKGWVRVKVVVVFVFNLDILMNWNSWLSNGVNIFEIIKNLRLRRLRDLGIFINKVDKVSIMILMVSVIYKIERCEVFLWFIFISKNVVVNIIEDNNV